MPRKPTQPFSNIVFRPDGTVGKNDYLLPDDKQAQECSAFDMFVKLFNETDQGCQIENFEPLSEDDHDFRASVGGRSIDVQLTELSPRECHQIQARLPERIDANPVPAPVDHAAADFALRKVIANKINKHYGKGDRPLWLVIFSTELYLLRYNIDDQLHVTAALPHAWDYLASLSGLVFEEIWFTDLQTRPVRVWPTTDQALPCAGHPMR
jgi:hypothetical protein